MKESEKTYITPPPPHSNVDTHNIPEIIYWLLVSIVCAVTGINITQSGND